MVIKSCSEFFRIVGVVLNFFFFFKWFISEKAFCRVASDLVTFFRKSFQVCRLELALIWLPFCWVTGSPYKLINRFTVFFFESFVSSNHKAPFLGKIGLEKWVWPFLIWFKMSWQGVEPAFFKNWDKPDRRENKLLIEF